MKIDFCPFCNSKSVVETDNVNEDDVKIHRCNDCNEDFTEDDCRFCDRCGKQIVDYELMDDDFNQFCGRKCWEQGSFYEWKGE